MLVNVGEIVDSVRIVHVAAFGRVKRYGTPDFSDTKACSVARETFAGRLEIRLFADPGAKEKVCARDSRERLQCARLHGGKEMLRDTPHVVVILELLNVNPNFTIGDGAQCEISGMREIEMQPAARAIGGEDRFPSFAHSQFHAMRLDFSIFREQDAK